MKNVWWRFDSFLALGGHMALTDCVIDLWIMDVDAKTNWFQDPTRVLAAHEHKMKKKYLQAYLKQ